MPFRACLRRFRGFLFLPFSSKFPTVLTISAVSFKVPTVLTSGCCLGRFVHFSDGFNGFGWYGFADCFRRFRLCLCLCRFAQVLDGFSISTDSTGAIWSIFSLVRILLMSFRPRFCQFRCFLLVPFRPSFLDGPYLCRFLPGYRRFLLGAFCPNVRQFRCFMLVSFCSDSFDCFC